MSVIARRVVVRGRVQGVGFRASMIDVALAQEVTGWVRNRRDGAVEALVQGAPDAVERVIAWCRHGPPSAWVAGVDVSDSSLDHALASFDLEF